VGNYVTAVGRNYVTDNPSDLGNYVTADSHVGFESWMERDHVMALDFDPTVVGIASQPFWLSWLR
jgi:hypothetical protein